MCTPEIKPVNKSEGLCLTSITIVATKNVKNLIVSILKYEHVCTSRLLTKILAKIGLMYKKIIESDYSPNYFSLISPTYSEHFNSNARKNGWGTIITFGILSKYF